MKYRSLLECRLLPFLCSILALTALASVLPEPIARVNGSGERAGLSVTVAAVRHSIESDDVNGSASFYDRNTSSRLSVDVTAVTILVTNRLARVSGEVTRSTGTYVVDFPLGSRVTFQIEDGGDAEGLTPDGFTPPDNGSVIVLPKPGEEPEPLPASERGNLQVEGLASGK